MMEKFDLSEAYENVYKQCMQKDEFALALASLGELTKVREVEAKEEIAWHLLQKDKPL